MLPRRERKVTPHARGQAGANTLSGGDDVHTNERREENLLSKLLYNDSH